MSEQNDMKKQLMYNKIKWVMGWDIGDGDSVAFGKAVNERVSKLIPLYTDKSRDQQVAKSAEVKDDTGTIIIGEDCAKQKNFAVNFKRSPNDWNSKSNLNMEYKEHMFDFIRGVSEAILQNSSNYDFIKSVITSDVYGNRHWNEDEVLLVVGCPSSVIWKGEEMRKQYENLISEATGIQNVIVTEESRAAVFSLLEIDSLREKINLQKGVLVVDFGSSTADATYILPGKKAINLSWELGAGRIENAMLDYILQSEKTQNIIAMQAKAHEKSRFLIAKSNCNHAVFQLRRDKEDFFDGKLGGNAAPMTVMLPAIDEDGNLAFYNGEPVEIAVTYNVTEEMMRFAVERYEFDTKKDGEVVSHGTWKLNCRRFLDDVKQTLEKEKISVGYVVVTGGGSKMPFTVELSRDIFSESWVVPSEAPSHSVVKGLATIAYNEVKAPAVRKKAIDDIISKCKPHTDKMIGDITSSLSEKAYDAAVDALKSMTRETTGVKDSLGLVIEFTNVGAITNTIDGAVQRSLNRNKDSEIRKSMKSWSDSDASDIVSVINDASSELYADRAISNMFKINKEDVNVISSKVKIPNISMPDIAGDANLIGIIVGYILSAVVFVVLACIAAIVPGIGAIFVTVVGLFAGSAIIEFFKKYEGTPVSLASVSGAVKNMVKKKSEKLNEINNPVRCALRESLTKEEVYGKDFEKHYKVLSAMADMAFDRILLITDDDQ